MEASSVCVLTSISFLRDIACDRRRTFVLLWATDGRVGSVVSLWTKSGGRFCAAGVRNLRGGSLNSPRFVDGPFGWAFMKAIAGFSGHNCSLLGWAFQRVHESHSRLFRPQLWPEKPAMVFTNTLKGPAEKATYTAWAIESSWS